MAQKKEPETISNITEDPLSGFLKGFSFEVHAFGHQHDDIHAVCDDRIIGDFELILVVGGQSRITIEETEHKLTGGDMILIPPFTRHRIQTLPCDPHDNYWIHFDVFPFYRQTEFLKRLSGMISRTGTEKIFDQLTALCRLMEEEISGQAYGYSSYLETLFLQLIIKLFRNNPKEAAIPDMGPGSPSVETEIVDRGMQFIRNNLESPITVMDLCEYLHISKSYLYKTFSRVVGLSPNYLIQIYKLKRAEQLMKTTSCSIKEISQLLGFSSQYYFSMVFKRFYGVAPHYYRIPHTGCP